MPKKSLHFGVTNKIERFLLGSVASAVAARAHCSVEVVRPRNSDEEATALGTADEKDKEA